MSSTARDELIQQLKRLKPQLQQRWPIERMWLFGSWGRNEATETSDVDLMVQFHPTQSKGLGLFALFDLVSEIEASLDKKVDLVEPGALKPQLAFQILPEAIEL